MRFLLNVSTDTFWNYVVEADNEQAARNRARTDFDNSLDQLEVDVEVEQVPDDTPEGDA